MKNFSKSVLGLSMIVLASCSSDDDSSGNSVSARADYTFNRGDETSISFSGQSTRIAMAEELVGGLRDTSIPLSTFENMFDHVEGRSDFDDVALNASDKSVRGKVAASDDFFSANSTDAAAIKADFDAWISEQVTDVFPAFEDLASAGVAGQIQEAGGGSTRYVNAKGVEVNQVVIKGLIGALMTDQIVNHYLSTARLDRNDNVANNDNDVLDGDNNYTTMEHQWDEAFGYLYGAEEDITAPVLDIDSFLNKYLSRVEGDPDFAGIADEVYDAFILGRAAIVAKNYDVRDEQAEILRERISEVIAIRAVFYLQQGILNLGTDNGSAFHDLGEGLGFVYSLQFTRKPNTSSPEPYFTRTQVQGFFSDLLDVENGLWNDATAARLQSISEEIAAEFDFTVEEAGSTN